MFYSKDRLLSNLYSGITPDHPWLPLLLMLKTVAFLGQISLIFALGFVDSAARKFTIPACPFAVAAAKA